MKNLRTYLNDLTLRAYAKVQVFAATEPVRLRSALLSVVLAGGLLVPALRDGDTALTVSSIGATVLPLLVGEATRNKVTPA